MIQPLSKFWVLEKVKGTSEWKILDDAHALAFDF